MRVLRKPTLRRHGCPRRLIKRCPVWLESLEDRTLFSISFPSLPLWNPAGPGPINNAVSAAPPNNAAGGAIQSIAVDPNHPHNLWVGTTNGGVWRTTNMDITNPGPINWTPLMDQLPSLAIGSVAIDPLDPSGNTVWAGTGNFSNGGVSNGPTPPALANGLWETTNGGDTWTHLGQNIAGVRVEKILPTGALGPSGKEVVLVATTDGGGLYRSTDGGATFTAGAIHLPTASLIDLVQDPANPATFYTTTLGSTTSGPGSPNSGIYKSTDQGASWTEIDNGPSGLPNLTPITALKIAAGGAFGSHFLYAGEANGSTLAGVFRSTDGGTTWTALATPPASFQTFSFISPVPFSIIVDPLNFSVVYVAGLGAGSFLRYDSTGSSGTWTAITGAAANGTAPHVDDHAMAFLPTSFWPDTLLEVDDGGIYYLELPGTPTAFGWQSLEGNLGNAEFYHTALDTNANLIFGGAQDNGVSIQSLPFSGVWNMVAGGDGQTVEFDPIGNVRYAMENNFGAIIHSGTRVLLGADAVDHPILSATFTKPPGSSTNAWVITSPNHGLQTGDGVHISGLAAGSPTHSYDFFQVTRIDQNTFSLDGSALTTPYSGGGTWRKTGLNADDLGVATKYDFTRFPIAPNVAAGNRVLLAGFSGIYESSNDGDTITDITAELPGFTPPSSPGGGPFTTLVSGGFDGSQPEPNVAFVSTSDGSLYVRGETGQTFSQIRPSPGFITSFAVDPQNWRHVYVIAAGDVWTTSDITSVRFTQITGNLSSLTSNFQSITVAPNPTSGGLIPLVGALGGVYRMVGTTWTEYGVNLPNVQVEDVRYYPAGAHSFEQVLAGTYGRGAWELFGPSGTTIATPSILQIKGDSDFPNENDVIKLQLDPNNSTLLNVFVNSSTPTSTFQAATIQQINVNGLGGNNRIIVDFSNGVFQVGGRINVNGGSGNNQLQVIDGGVGDKIEVTSASVIVDGSAVLYTGFSGLEVDSAASATVNVLSTSTSLTINAGTGDSINLGGTSRSSGNLNSVNGAVTINGGPGLVSLNLFDGQNSSPQFWAITSSAVVRSSFSLTYAGNIVLALTGGTGNNTFAVFATSGATTINAGSGNNAVNVGYSGLRGALTVNGGTGTASLTINDTTNVANTAWAMTNQFVVSGGGFQVNYQSLASLTIDAGKGVNNYLVLSTAAGTPLTLNTGTGNDTISLGSFSTPISMAGILAAVTVNGQGGADHLFLDDQGNTASTSYLISSNSLIKGFTFAPIVTYSNMAAVTLNAGSGADSVTVSSTAAGTPVTVNAGTGTDTINVGSLISPSLAGILAPVIVNGQSGGTASLFVDDQANTVSTEYDVTASNVARFRGTFLPSIAYNRLAAVTVNAGSGGNPIFVTGTAANTPVTINAGAGADTINLGGGFESMAGILASVTVNGQGSADRLILNDQLDPTGIFYDFDATSVVRVTNTFLPTILYTGLASLTVNAGSGANQFRVEATAASTPITINTGRGNDTITLGTFDFNLLAGIRSAVTVNGQGGADQLVLNDQGNTTTADQLTATGSGVTSNTSGSFFAPGGSLAYSGIATATINTSNAPQGDNITVFPASGMEFIVNAGNPTTPPGDSLTVQPLNGIVLTQHSTGTGAGFYTLPGSTTQLVAYTGIETVTPVGLLAVGVDVGHPSDVKVYDAQSGALKYELHPFAADFLGGVRVAVGDVNGDGIPDVVTAQGPGGGSVQVFDGATGKPLSGPLSSFTPFGADYHGGLWVAAADVNGDGYADVVVGEDAGGEPRVRVFSGRDGSLLADFLAFAPSFHGGVRVGAADFNHDHHADIVAGEGPGGQAVNVFEGATLGLGNGTPAPAFSIPQPFVASYHQGVYVSTGDVFGDGTPKLLVSQGAGRDPEVAVFDGAAGGKELESFVVRGFRDGARVGAADINGDGRADIIVGAVHGDSVVRGYDGLSLQEDGHLTAFAPNYHGGVFVGGFGRWGDFSTGVGRTLSGAQGDLQKALADLATLEASLANSQDRESLAEALDLLSGAFNSPAWLDSSHLQSGSGEEVFAAEETAVNAIAHFILHSPDTVLSQELERDLRQIALSDEEVAQTAIADAKDRDSEKFSDAQASLLKGEHDFAAAFANGGFSPDRLDRALDHFRQAWEDVLKA